MSNENVEIEEVMTEVTEAVNETEAPQEETIVEEVKAEEHEIEESSPADDDETEEPRIIFFPDEEEEEDNSVTEEEEYVPKAVAFNETVAAKAEEKKELTPEQIKLEKEIENERFIRGETAWMFSRTLFNLPAWLSLFLIFGTVPPIFAATYGLEIFGVSSNPVNISSAIGLLYVIVLVHVYLVIMAFVGMRIIVASANKRGSEMSTAGFTMLRAVIALMIVEPILGFFIYPSALVGVICAICLLFIVTLTISIHAVRKSLIRSKIKKISPICGVLFFVIALLHAFPIYEFVVEEFSFGYFITFVISAVAMVLFGIFTFAYNAHMDKVKKAIEEDQ